MARDDIDGLQYLYGLRDETPYTKVDDASNPLNWYTGASGIPDDALNRVSACDNVVYGRTPVVYNQAAPRWLKHRDFLSSIGWSSTTHYLPYSAQSITHPGVACQNADAFRVYYQDNVDGGHQVWYVETTNGGGSWSSPALADSEITQITNGVDATYDPVSGYYIYSHVHEFDLVGFKVHSPGSRVHYYKISGIGECTDAPPFNTGEVDCWRTSDTPNIVCGSTALGQWNCLVAWPDVDWYRATKWARAKVVTDPEGGHQLQLDSIHTHGYYTLSAPSIGLGHTSSSFPWRLLLHQGGNVTYTWWRDNSSTASWQDQRGFAFGTKHVSPVFGSTYYTAGWSFYQYSLAFLNGD